MRGGVLDEGEGGSTSIHACGDARVIGVCSPAASSPQFHAAILALFLAAHKHYPV